MRTVFVELNAEDAKLLETVRVLRQQHYGGKVETYAELVRNLIREEVAQRTIKGPGKAVIRAPTPARVRRGRA